MAETGASKSVGIPNVLEQLNDGVSDSSYKTFDDWIVMNYKLEWMRKETGVSQIK